MISNFDENINPADEEIVCNLTLNESVRILIQLRALDITLAREILSGKNIVANIGMLKENEKVHDIIYNEVGEIIDRSKFGLAYLLYQHTALDYLRKLNDLYEEAKNETEN